MDDHDDFRASARAWLTHEGYTVVGAFATGEEALEGYADLSADVILLDLNLPGMSGVKVAEVLAASAGAPRVVIISSDAEARHDPQVVSAPVAGFLAKSELACDAIDALLS